MNLAIVKVIIMACQVGSIGMGGDYTSESVILAHHQIMLQRSMDIQRNCQKKVMECVVKRQGDKWMAKEEDVAICLMNYK